MKNISDLPRLPLGQYPTPFYKLESVSARYGRDVYIKRDDLCGVALGGNKVRKLEFLLAQAKADGCDTVFTTGGSQSNHAALTAACAARLGMILNKTAYLHQSIEVSSPLRFHHKILVSTYWQCLDQLDKRQAREILCSRVYCVLCLRKNKVDGPEQFKLRTLPIRELEKFFADGVQRNYRQEIAQMKKVEDHLCPKSKKPPCFLFD